MINGTAHMEKTKIRRKKSYSALWPYDKDTPTPQGLSPKKELLLVMAVIFIPIQIVFGILFYCLKYLFNSGL